MFPHRIETARLVLRKPEADDAEAIFLRYARDPEVTRFLVWKPHKDVETTKAFIADCEVRWTSGSGFPYVVSLRGEHCPIGMMDLRPRGHRVELGYVLARAFWGHGFMPEAIAAVARVSLENPGIFRVEAACDLENLRSARALEKAGLTWEGVLRRRNVLPNISPEPRDARLYAMTR